MEPFLHWSVNHFSALPCPSGDQFWNRAFGFGGGGLRGAGTGGGGGGGGEEGGGVQFELI